MLKKLLLYTALFLIPMFGAFSQNTSDFYDINFIREIRITFEEQNWDHVLDSLFINFGDDAKLEGTVSIDGHIYQHAGIRYKGYSSWDVDQAKNPFNIELDYRNTYQNYQGFTKLKLSNVVRDPSFIREVLSYTILRKYMPASRANFADVYVNDVHIGLYTNVESVDKLFAEREFGSGSNSFFKGSPELLEYPYGQNANLAYTHGTDSTGYVPYYNMVSDHGWNDLLYLIAVLNNDTTNIPSVLNVDRALWMHAFDYAVVNLDSYIGYSQNYYMYKDDNGVFNAIIWDLNMSFGSFRNTDATALNLSIAAAKQLDPLKIVTSTTYSPRPLIKNLLSNSMYRKMFLAHMRTIINENVRNGEYYLIGKQIQSIVDTYVQADPNKFFSYSNFIKNIDTTVGPTSNQYPGIKDLMEARLAYLDTFPGFNGYPDIIEIAHQPESPSKGQEIWFTVKVSNANHVILGFRNDSRGIFQKIQMYDDGSHNDSLAGDNIYGVSVIPTGKVMQYFMYAENNASGIFSPERAEYEFYSIQPLMEKEDVVINEFGDGRIELFNNTNEVLSLSGNFLSDDKLALSKWAFPDTSISAKSYLIVYTSEQTTSFMHTNFSLPQDGGGLYFSNTIGGILDSVIWENTESGKSIGRYPNGVGSFVYMPRTFSFSNNIGTDVDNELLVFPNPSNGIVTLEFGKTQGVFYVEIVNISGESMWYESFDEISGSVNVISKSFDLSTLSKGVYVFRLICDNKITTKKIIII
ncbi:MAG: CotH kinase family protein [Bacteroidota bacterium]